MVENKLNILQKIQSARVELQSKEIKKTGYNTYSNYKYFELGDFLPHINELCNKYGLYTEFLYEETKASLSIYNVDNIEEVRAWSTPVEVANLKGCSVIQNIGGTQSFARRYLYIMAFEIAESDLVDGVEIDEVAEEAKKKISRAAVITINKLLDETEADREKFLSYAGVTKVEDITNDAMGACISMLNKKKQAQEEKAKKKNEDFDF